MVQIDGFDLLVPDIYANELRRQLAYRAAISNAKTRSSEGDDATQRPKSAAMPMDYAMKRRGLSVG